MKVKIVQEDSDTVRASHRFEEISDSDTEIGQFVVDTCFICNREGKIKPKDSHSLISYCSDEHRQLHHPQDQDEAFPYLVKHRPEVGRYMVAARDIKAGEVIFSEDPIAIGPSHTALPSCLDCMKQVDGSYVCPNCNWPCCAEICAFGSDHSSQECQIFAAMKNKVQISNFNQTDSRYWSITVLRVMLLKERDPAKYDLVTRMVDHNVEHKKDRETWKMYKKNVVDYLLKDCGLKGRFSESEVLHVLGALDVNSVKINCQRQATASAAAAPGHALYSVTALISHCCISNSKTILREDYSNDCVATVDIPEGEEITKQYVSPLETTNMRRAKLKSGWYFDCQCLRCRDPAELGSFVSCTMCLRCQGGNILPLDPLDPGSVWRCDHCDFETNGKAVDKLVDYFLDKMKSLSAEAVDDWEELLTKATKMFHPNHYIPTLIRISMNGHYIRLSQRVGLEPDQIPVEVFMRRKDLLDEVQRVIDLVEPGLSRRRGLSLFETATCHLQIGRLLHDADRFPAEDFLQLCQAKLESLKECQECLENSAEGTPEASVHYKASGAMYEAEYMLRVLKQKLEEQRLHGTPDNDD